MSSEPSADPTARPVAVQLPPGAFTDEETTVIIEAETETVRISPTAAVARFDGTRVKPFVEAHQLGGYVDAAVSLARRCFPKAKNIALEMGGEPGEYGERLFVEVATGTGADESLHQYHDFVKRWVATTPPWVTDLMGLSTDLR